MLIVCLWLQGDLFIGGQSKSAFIWFRSCFQYVHVSEILCGKKEGWSSAPFTQKALSNQTAFCWSTQQIRLTNLNMREICAAALTQNYWNHLQKLVNLPSKIVQKSNSTPLWDIIHVHCINNPGWVTLKRL